MKDFVTSHLVKSEDLNHHGTLFAGRMTEWFTESCFVAAAMTFGKAENIVCIKIHGLKFAAPTHRGDIVTLTTTVVKLGTTSITVYGKVVRNNSETITVDGFITFVCVDENGKKMSHNLVLSPAENEEIEKIRELAKNL